MERKRVFRSLSYGYHDPGGMVLWWLIQPTKHLHIISELKIEELDEQDVAAQIKARDTDLGIGVDKDGLLLYLEVPAVAYTVGSPEILSNLKQRKAGFRGETIGDRLLKFGVVVIAADDDRLNGWARCLSLFKEDANKRPWLTIDPKCKELIKAIPASMLDEKHDDDIVNESPAMKAFRYGAMSRPTPALYHEPIVIPPGSPADAKQKIWAQRGGRQFGQAR